ncbi:TetR/AcrR family transcriptional regulator [Amycolatopsis pithecellobii]|uniref:TetR/AcrR family transcriptional regulator n=1 Tax=Amycolatopsis pithecellobii TaxID=664692 RepID=UPI0012B78626|nr:TetR/AcrR family transcriptional regulator [Amycolatopsis pithecellobii]
MTTGRPRDPHRDKAILTAARELIAERGYAGLSIEGVAARAGTGKTTIYRRWREKRELVLAAMDDYVGHNDAATEDTGSLRGDLLAYGRRLATLFNGFDGRFFLGLMQGYTADPSFAEAVVRNSASGIHLPPAVIQRAVERGELSGPVDHQLFEEIVPALVIMRLMRGQSLDGKFVDHVIDDIVLPAFEKAGSA